MMKFSASLLLLAICLLSCQGDVDSVSVEAGNESSTVSNQQKSEENGQEIPFEVNIDDSDLALLPEDTGGTHTAHPKGSSVADYGYYAYLPGGYQEDGPAYPLIIFLHGWNENLGNEPLENVLVGGPPELIEIGQWNPSYPFIVISPQLTSQYWSPIQLHRFIEYLIENYQINTKRIYLTGLSLGGGGCWHYVGEIDDNYAAAIVPISSRGAEFLIDNLRKVPIWAFHGERDTSVDAYQNYGSVPMVNAINDAQPTTRARVTVYPNLAHNAWTTTYNGDGRFHNQLYDAYEVVLYDWMLTYRKE